MQSDPEQSQTTGAEAHPEGPVTAGQEPKQV